MKVYITILLAVALIAPAAAQADGPVRSGLRGVIVTSDSVETRALSMGFPRVRRYRWAQIDRIILDKDSVLFELWNGEYERLPKVQKGEELVDLLERVAHARGRQVTRLDRKR